MSTPEKQWFAAGSTVSLDSVRLLCAFVITQTNSKAHDWDAVLHHAREHGCVPAEQLNAILNAYPLTAVNAWTSHRMFIERWPAAAATDTRSALEALEAEEAQVTGDAMRRLARSGQATGKHE